MIALMFCVRKHPDQSTEAFLDYWWNKHGPYVAARAHFLNMKSYTQMPRLEFPGAEGVSTARGGNEAFDGIAMVTWDSIESLKATFGDKDAKRAARELIEDERTFVDFARSTIFFTAMKPVVADGKSLVG